MSQFNNLDLNRDFLQFHKNNFADKITSNIQKIKSVFDFLEVDEHGLVFNTYPIEQWKYWPIIAEQLKNTKVIRRDGINDGITFDTHGKKPFLYCNSFCDSLYKKVEGYLFDDNKIGSFWTNNCPVIEHFYRLKLGIPNVKVLGMRDIDTVSLVVPLDRDVFLTLYKLSSGTLMESKYAITVYNEKGFRSDLLAISKSDNISQTQGSSSYYYLQVSSKDGKVLFDFKDLKDPIYGRSTTYLTTQYDDVASKYAQVIKPLKYLIASQLNVNVKDLHQKVIKNVRELSRVICIARSEEFSNLLDKLFKTHIENFIRDKKYRETLLEGKEIKLGLENVNSESGEGMLSLKLEKRYGNLLGCRVKDEFKNCTLSGMLYFRYHENNRGEIELTSQFGEPTFEGILRSCDCKTARVGVKGQLAGKNVETITLDNLVKLSTRTNFELLFKKHYRDIVVDVDTDIYKDIPRWSLYIKNSDLATDVYIDGNQIDLVFEDCSDISSNWLKITMEYHEERPEELKILKVSIDEENKSGPRIEDKVCIELLKALCKNAVSKDYENQDSGLVL